MSITVHSAMTVPEGDGVTVNRLLPVHGRMNFDPFVLWDHFDINSGGFPPHPHRGFEAITYMFAGGMQHKDNLGNEGTVHAGGAQRFTAGKGIVHSEIPSGHAAGIQLWINLPQRLKGIAPAYQQVEKGNITEQISAGTSIAHIVSERGAIKLHTDVEYLDIHMQADGVLERNVPAGMRGIVYVVSGDVSVTGKALQAGQATFVESEASLTLKASSEARLMWCFGRPQHEPIHQHGPFVD